MGMDRRQFLRRSGMFGGAAFLGESVLAGCAPDIGRDISGVGAEYHPDVLPTGRMLDFPASESPIEHVVVLMMENRSFDHYLGWLSRDEGYLERGLSRYGNTFAIDAKSMQSYLDATSGQMVDTFHLDPQSMANPWRGCGFNDPGHGWTAGHAQRDGGFLAPNSGNDRYALGYHEADDLPFHSRMARRFTTFDHYHASMLTSTQTNRRYLHSAQSGGYNYNYIPIAELGFQFDTIWDRLWRAGVPVRSYFSDLPSLAFWGPRLGPLLSPIDQYFESCHAGNLPAVSFLDPPYAGPWQADDHPHADPGAGQRFLRDVFQAFAESPCWENGLFLLTYDEWGGFFDHVAPPVLPDDRATNDDATNYGQAGFRVPTIMASPYAMPGFVDHRTYDHTSIMRFLQWRFLGAPAEGPGDDGSPWALKVRDRFANNIGNSLAFEQPDPTIFDIGDLPLRWPTAWCDGTAQLPAPGRPEAHPTATNVAPTILPGVLGPVPGEEQTEGGPGVDFADLLESGYYERAGLPTEPSSMARIWATPSS